MRKKILLILLLLWIITSCDKDEKFYIVSPDGKKTITVLTNKKDSIRYIIDGRSNNLSKMKSYVILDISKVSYIGDGFCGGFDFEECKWMLLNNGAKVIYTTKDADFCVETEYRLDESGIPSENDFICDTCFRIDYETLTLHSMDLCKIEYPFFRF